MRHVLHLITHPADPAALDVVARQAADAEVRLSVVLLHGAAGLELPAVSAAQVFRLGDRPASIPGSPYPHIDHSGLLDLIFSADTVVTW
jgi:hypothetical protein